MICNNCNSEIDDNSFVCSVCGTSVQNAEVMQESNLPNGNIAGFVLGLISIVAWIIPFIGFPVTIVGLVLSIINLKTQKRKLSIIGIVLCSVFLLFTIINSALGVYLVMKGYI